VELKSKKAEVAKSKKTLGVIGVCIVTRIVTWSVLR